MCISTRRCVQDWTQLTARVSATQQARRPDSQELTGRAAGGLRRRRQRRRGATEARRRTISWRVVGPELAQLARKPRPAGACRVRCSEPEISRLRLRVRPHDRPGRKRGVERDPVGEKETARAPYTQERREVECR